MTSRSLTTMNSQPCALPPVGALRASSISRQHEGIVDGVRLEATYRPLGLHRLLERHGERGYLGWRSCGAKAGEVADDRSDPPLETEARSLRQSLKRAHGDHVRVPEQFTYNETPLRLKDPP